MVMQRISRTERYDFAWSNAGGTYARTVTQTQMPERI